jgi:hypothetical protein
MNTPISDRVARPLPQQPAQRVAKTADDNRAAAAAAQNQQARSAQQDKANASRQADKGRYVDRYA